MRHRAACCDLGLFLTALSRDCFRLLLVSFSSAFSRFNVSISRFNRLISVSISTSSYLKPLGLLMTTQLLTYGSWYGRRVSCVTDTGAFRAYTNLYNYTLLTILHSTVTTVNRQCVYTGVDIQVARSYSGKTTSRPQSWAAAPQLVCVLKLRITFIVNR